MASDLERLAERLRAGPRLVETEMRKAVTAGGQLLAASARRRIPTRLSGVGRAGAPVGVAVSVRGTKRISALIRATGPLHLLDNPTRPHDIAAKPGSALKTPYGAKANVHSPGTSGQHRFEAGIAEGLPAARAVVEGAFVRAARSL